MSKTKFLDLYGKRIHFGRWYNKLMLIILIGAIVGTVLIAFSQGCILANITVYQDGPCPAYGQMDCYYGNDNVYFGCKPGIQVNATTSSAACFRWIIRDVSINDIMTQFGACVGLFNALSAIVQLVLRYLIYSFRRRQVGQENRQAGATACLQNLLLCLSNLLPCRKKISRSQEIRKDNNKPETEFKHPYFLLAAWVFIIVLFLAPCVGGALLGVFHISTTALTYIIILLVLFITIIGLVWVALAEEDEIAVETERPDSSFEKDVIGNARLGVFEIDSQRNLQQENLREGPPQGRGTRTLTTFYPIFLLLESIAHVLKLLIPKY